jgi:hypothetical protein
MSDAEYEQCWKVVDATKADRDAWKSRAEEADSLAIFLRTSYDSLLSSSQNILSDRNRLKAENERLIKLLNRYGQCDVDCPAPWTTGAKCNCGFEAALAATEGKATP